MKSVIYRFPKNSACVEVYYKEPNQSDKRVKDDFLYLRYKTQEKKIKEAIGMRADEALLLAEILIQSVRQITEAYQISKPIIGYKLKK